MLSGKRYLNQFYNQGHSTWITPLWYLPFSLPMLFCNAFLVKLSKFQANIERERKKGHRAQHFNVTPSTDPSFNTMNNCSLRDSGHFVYIVDFQKKLFAYAVEPLILEASSPKCEDVVVTYENRPTEGPLGGSHTSTFSRKKNYCILFLSYYRCSSMLL